jgi:hypothetical protein
MNSEQEPCRDKTASYQAIQHDDPEYCRKSDTKSRSAWASSLQNLYTLPLDL